MIGYLKGQIMEVGADTLTLEVAGVGYEIQAHLRLLAGVDSGDQTQLWIYTHVREDALQLFGFESPDEKSFFLSLLKVNGVGPKLALNALGGATVDQMTALIENENVKGLSALPKVGKKTAEQMILTLKGKLVHKESAGGANARPKGVHGEISFALINLGFRPADVERVMEKLPPVIELEEGLKFCLSRLAST